MQIQDCDKVFDMFHSLLGLIKNTKKHWIFIDDCSVEKERTKIE